MRRPSDETLSRGQLEAVLRNLRRGMRRPEALRQAGIDPVRFAAEYRRSPAIREAIARAEGGTPSRDTRSDDQTFLPPRPRAGPAPSDDQPDVPETLPSFSGWTLWLVVLGPLLASLALLAAGAAPAVPPLGW
jgi:hypothetical protein